LGSFENKDKEV